MLNIFEKGRQTMVKREKTNTCLQGTTWLILGLAFAVCIMVSIGSGSVGDFDGDGDVGGDDLAAFGALWLTDSNDADFDDSGIADYADLAALGLVWLEGVDPVSRWEMEGDFHDSGYGHSGTPFGGPEFVYDSKARVGSGALRLHGDDDYIEIVGYKGITGTNPRTVCAWIKTPATTTQELLAWGSDEPGKKWLLMIKDTGEFRVTVDSGSINGTSKINDSIWHHVAVVWADDGTPDISDAKLYVDGIEEQTSNSPMPIDTSSDINVHIGVSPDSTRFFTGRIDDVRIYDRALDAMEIEALGPQFVGADDPNILYTGRIVFDDPKEPVFGWPGTYLMANFEGTSIIARMNNLDDGDGTIYFTAVIDDGTPVVLDFPNGRCTRAAATGLTDTVHELLLFKRSEHYDGSIAFEGFMLDDGKSLSVAPSRPARRIEFYGDSITVGLALDSTSDQQYNEYTNNYLAYGAVTARNFGAEYHCMAISGIPLVRAWGSEIDMPNNYYYRHDPTSGSSYWDFNQWVPNVVVVNLGQNDSWHNVSQTDMENGYIDFGLTLRGHYPGAHIIFALGSMNATAPGKPWPDYLQNAVDTLNTTYNDPNVYSVIFPYDGLGTHPHAPQHEDMATQLTTFIEGITGW